MQMLLPFDLLLVIRDGDPDARALYDRHYSARHYRDGRKPKRLIGPGQYLLLTTTDRKALIAFRRSNRQIAGRTGIYLSVFRNESSLKASTLLTAACMMAWDRWPGQEIFTFVNPQKVKSPLPGYCFLRAGFREKGKTQRGLLIFVAQAQSTR